MSAAALPEPPEDFRWRVQQKHGFAIALPRRFHLLVNTVDPVAQMMRGPDGEDDRDAEFGQGRFPTGFWDGAIIGELEDGRPQPFRMLEFDSVGGRLEPLPDEQHHELWFEARQVFTSALEAAELPGYRLLDVSDVTMGSLDALAFDYRWDGLCDFEGGGDRGQIVWAPTEWVVFHVYHHCPEAQWAVREPELAAILATFTMLGGATAGREP